MLTAETKRRLDACRDILVGKLPLPTDQIELITLALIYKFMDDLDEESVRLGGKRSFFVGLLEKYRWRALLPQAVSAEDRMNLFAEGIEAIGKAEHLPALFRDIFRNSFLKFRDGRILTLFLNEVNAFEYSHSEELGNAFEYLLKTMGIQAENGQFRTPRHIINFMIECLDPQPNDRILDPACGTGGFLVSAYKHILAQHTSPGSKIPGDKLTHDQRQKVYSHLSGYDVTDLMVKLSKVNLFLHGFPDPAIHIYDTLTNDARWNEKADLILANPPFMTPKGGVSPHTKFRVAAKKSEVLFTDYIAEHLTPDGRGALIVPNGIVATAQNAYVKLRKFLVEDSLVAVVSIPGGVFKPYSGVKTSILFLDKKLARKIDNILFLKVNADGFDLGDQRRPISENDLPEAQDVVMAWLRQNVDQEIGTRLAWKAIPKSQLLAQRACKLQAEAFIGGQLAEEQTIEPARLADVVEINPKKSEVRGLDGITRVSFVPMEDLNSDRPAFVPSKQRELAAVLTGYTYFKDGDVLLAKITPCFENGKAGIARGLLNGIGFGSTEFFVLRGGENILPELLYYYVTRSEFRDEGAARMSGTAGQQRVTRDFLENYEIPLPQLEQQQQIVAEIGSYQKVVDGARQIIMNYFQRFDLNGCWDSVPLGKVCMVISGQHIEKDDYNNDGRGLAYLTGPSDFGVIHPKISKWTEKPKVKANSGDVLVTVKGSGVGSVNLLDVNDVAISRQLMAVRAIEIEPKFLYAFLASQQDHLRAQATGAAIPGIAREHLLTLEIPLPPVDKQREIIAKLDEETAQIESVRSLIPQFEAKIQRVLDNLWGDSESK